MKILWKAATDYHFYWAEIGKFAFTVKKVGKDQYKAIITRGSLSRDVKIFSDIEKAVNWCEDIYERLNK